MGNLRQKFFRSIAILNTLLVPVFIIFLTDQFNSTFFSGIPLISLIVVSLKVYFLSGISGCIIEFISGEESTLQARRLLENAKALWFSFFMAIVIILIFDFILFALFQATYRAWRPLFYNLTGIIAAFVLARWVINKKYVKPLRIPRRSFKFGIGFMSIILSAGILEFTLVKTPGFIYFGDFQWSNLSAFLLDYIHFFEFIYCSIVIMDLYPEVLAKFSHQKEIFLINPMGAEVVKGLSYWFRRVYPPVFVVLKALSSKTYKFREFNRVLWHERYYKDNVLVCITCFTSNCYEAYKIAKEFKKRGAKVVMGGPHVTYLPNEALAFCDSIVIGQAEGVWKELLRDYENGTLKAQYKGSASEEDYSQVHTELINSTPFVTKEFLETSRGCKFRCNFCTVPALSDGKVRIQSINDIVELVQKVKPYSRNLTFIDNNIYSDPAYSRELFTALKPLKIRWNSLCTIDIAKNQETLKLARESGCDLLGIGYEVFGGSLEKNQGGKFAMAQKYLEYTRIIKKTGIKIRGLFIFGFDSDSPKTLIELWKFCFSLRPQLTHVSLLTPLPGSGVYRDMLKQDRIINLNWRNYAVTKLVIRHPHMDPAVMSFLFPLIQIFFFLTTSVGGYAIMLIFLFFPHFGLVYLIFRGA